MKCRTFTHHVGGKIRVECAACPRWFVDVEKTGEHTARAVAAAEQAEHEAADLAVESSSSTPLTGNLAAARRFPRTVTVSREEIEGPARTRGLAP